MRAFVLSVVIGIALCAQNCEVNLPHGHKLADFVDTGFDRIDHSPKDGQVTQAEFDYIIELDDANNDSCVSYTEYANDQTKQMFLEITRSMYLHFDPDSDDCLDIDEMNAEFAKIDTNSDGILEKAEYEKYYVKILHSLFGHGSCSHG
ncbi:hypothetical protein ACF0H5_010943 [Mactra antiquata]